MAACDEARERGDDAIGDEIQRLHRLRAERNVGATGGLDEGGVSRVRERSRGRLTIFTTRECERPLDDAREVGPTVLTGSVIAVGGLTSARPDVGRWTDGAPFVVRARHRNMSSLVIDREPTPVNERSRFNEVFVTPRARSLAWCAVSKIPACAASPGCRVA